LLSGSFPTWCGDCRRQRTRPGGQTRPPDRRRASAAQLAILDVVAQRADVPGIGSIPLPPRNIITFLRSFVAVRLAQNFSE
jgi:hypothetical protein